jgi:hypothetical protein
MYNSNFEVAAISTMINEVQNYYSKKRMKIHRKLVPVRGHYYRLECTIFFAQFFGQKGCHIRQVKWGVMLGDLYGIYNLVQVVHAEKFIIEGNFYRVPVQRNRLRNYNLIRFVYRSRALLHQLPNSLTYDIDKVKYRS